MTQAEGGPIPVPDSIVPQDSSVHVSWKYIAVTAISVIAIMAGAWAKGSVDDRANLRVKVEALAADKLDKEEFHAYRLRMDALNNRLDDNLSKIATTVEVIRT